jgi:hypothetical protein
VIGALVIGTLLAVGALAFVLYPMFFGVTRPRKLSDTDYAELKARYTRDAIAAMRRSKSSPAGALDDEIEHAVRAYRESHAACPVHGPRPEGDAVYCSDCGRYLKNRCADCGAPVNELDARYCENCGHRLAA